MTTSRLIASVLALFGLVSSVAATAQPSASVSPASLHAIISTCNDTTSLLLSIQNSGSAALSYSFAGGLSSFTPTSISSYVVNTNSSNLSVLGIDNNIGSASPSVNYSPWKAVIRPDGKFVYVTQNANSSVAVIDASTNTMVTEIITGSNPTGIACTPNSRFAYVCNSSDNSIAVINLLTNTVSNIITHPYINGPSDIAISPDGSKAYVCNTIANRLVVISTSTNTVIQTISGFPQSEALALSPDGLFAYVLEGSSSNGHLRIVNLSSNSIAATLGDFDFARGLDVSPDGTRLYVAEYNQGRVQIINTALQAVIDTITDARLNHASDLKFSANGDYAYVTIASPNPSNRDLVILSSATGTILGTRSTGGYAHSIAVLKKQIVALATPSATAGSITNGSSTGVSIIFDGSGLNAGEYSTSLLLNTNDPLHPQLTIPCLLTLSGTPEIHLSDTCFNYGSVITGANAHRTLYIRNTGCDTLQLTNITSLQTELSAFPTSGNIPPYDSLAVEMGFQPSALGTFSGNFIVHTNLPDVSICAKGVGLPAPAILTSPSSFLVNLSCGDSAQEHLTIYNSGAADLHFNLPAISTQPRAAACSPLTTFPTNANAGIDSVSFNTIHAATSSYSQSYDDQTANYNTVVMPGHTYSMFVHTGDWSDAKASAWIDFNDDGQFTPDEQIMDSSSFATSGAHTAQVTIPATAVRNKALRMRIGNDPSFITAPLDPCESPMNGQYEDYAVFVEQWVTGNIGSGTIASGDSLGIDLHFFTEQVNAGNYPLSLIIESDDPGAPSLAISSMLRVSGSPELALSENCVHFTTAMVGGSIADTVWVINNGCDTLHITSISSSLAEFTTPSSFYTVSPHDSLALSITFHPTAATSYSGTFTLITNAGDTSICFSGSGSPSPQVSSTPLSIISTLPCGGTSTVPVMLYNTGGADLHYALESPSTSIKPASCIPSTLFTYSWNVGVLDVEFNGLHNTTDGTVDGYQDYSSLSALVQPGHSYPLSVQTGNNWNEYVKAWIDFNDNGAFDASELVLDDINNYNLSTWHTAMVNIPSTCVQNKALRMRIGSSSNFDGPLLNACSNVSNGQFEDYTVIVGQWAQSPATTGTILAGDSAVVNIDLQSAGLNAGHYTSAFHIASDDPATPDYSLPIDLTITGSPVISTSVSCLHFGDLVATALASDTLFIYNTGCDTLHIYNMTLNTSEFLSSASSLDVLPNDTAFSVISFNPSAAGSYLDTLWINSNAIITSLCLSGSGLPAPTISANPTSIESTLNCSDAITLPITLYNTGNSALIINLADLVNPQAASCTPATLNNPGTDDYGIRHVVFNTIDNSTDPFDGYQDYSNSQSTLVRPGETYLLSVESGYWGYENTEAWIDYNNNGTFEASERVMDEWGMMHSTNVTIPLNAVQNYPLRMRIGSDADNESVLTGCSSPVNGQYEDYAVRVGGWMSVTPTTGSIASGDSLQLDVTLSAAGMPAGSYPSSVNLNTNDPLHSTFLIPCTMHVTGLPEIGLSATCAFPAAVIEFSHSSDSLLIFNTGCDTLHISSFSSTSSAFSASASSMHVLPFDTARIYVDFAPVITGIHTGTLTIHSNAADTSICFNATALPRPIIASSTASLLATTGACCDTAFTTITLYNQGGTALNFNLNGVDAPLPANCHPQTTNNDFALDYGINQVVFNTLSSNTLSNDGYQDYSSTQSTTVIPGESYTLEVMTGGLSAENVKAWIDYNNNGIFEASEEVMSSHAFPHHIATVTIPTNAAESQMLRMRIGSDADWNPAPSPCTNVERGQFEDYGVWVRNWMQISPTTGSILPGDSLICSLSLSGCGMTGSTQHSAIRVSSNDPLNALYTIPVQLSVDALPGGPSTSTVYGCVGLTNPAMQASALPGATIKWYSDSLLTTLVHTGDGFIPTDNTPGTHTYYATQTIIFCETTGSPANLVIQTTPASPIALDTIVCLSSIQALTASGSNMLLWYNDAALTHQVGSGPSFNTGLSAIGTYSFYVVDSIAGCPSSLPDIATLTITSPPPTPVTVDTAICFGQSMPTLSATGTHVTWYDNAVMNTPIATGNNYTPATTTAGSYTYYLVEGNNAACLSFPDSLIFTIHGLPTANASNDGPVCQYDSLHLISSGGISSIWSGPSSYSANQDEYILANGNIGGTYNLTITDANGCSNTANTVVVYHAAPIAPTMLGDTICAGDAAGTLTANGSGNITWYDNAALSSNTGAGGNYNPAPLAAGTYTYFATTTNNNGCRSLPSSVSYVVNGLPNATASSNSPICDSQTLMLQSTGGIASQWSGPNGFNASQDTSIIHANPALSGNYEATITDIHGCSNTATVSILVNANPAAPTVTDEAVCFGNSNPALLASGGNNYQWYSDAGLTQPISSANAFTSSETLTGSYTYFAVQIDANSCISAADSGSLTIHGLPTVTATNNGPVCENTPVTLSSSSNGTHSWTGPGGFHAEQDTSFIAAAEGMYLLTLTDANNCSSIDSTLISINPTPNAPTLADTSICFGANNPALIASGGTNYHWYSDAGLGTVLSSNSNYTSNETAAGAYSYFVTNSSAQGCVSSAASVQFTIHGLPTAGAQANSPLCEGSTLLLQTTAGNTYTWSGPNGFSSLTQNNTIDSIGLVESGTYTVIAENGFGCTAADSVIVVVHSIPAAPSATDAIGCEGLAAPALFATGVNIEWYNSTSNLLGTGNTYNSSETAGGVYTFYVTQTITGCQSLNTPVVLTLQPSPAAPGASNDSACYGIPAPALNATGGNLTWYADAGLTTPVGSGSSYQSPETAPGIYTYYIADSASGCPPGPATMVTLTIHDLPHIEVTPPSYTLVAGTTIEFVASNALSYTWTPALGLDVDTGSIVLAFPDSNTVYIVTGIDANGCIGDTTVEVIVIPDGIHEVLSGVSIGCYPNPSSGALTVTLQVNKFEETTVDFNNLLGQSVLHANKILSPGENNLQFDLHELPPGVYMLSIRIRNKMLSKRIVLQK